MSQKPNLLVILTDQHNPHVMRCAGDPIIRTPNLDRLASRSVRFTSTYCGSPLCAPSRMTFLTSRHCSDIEVWTNGCSLDLFTDIPLDDSCLFSHLIHIKYTINEITRGSVYERHSDDHRRRSDSDLGRRFGAFEMGTATRE
ncbi:MAG: hypothetical protein CME25_12370 [Gemmatimonadetes bacterium]|nr:hypothetical protein [Gemmatimonadota bacterium]MBB29682.1 hypothetical protein [Gemmatimonadota bacterium]